MKAETYNALAQINRGFDATLESLNLLEREGVANIEYVHNQTEIIEELRAGINSVILNRLGAREIDDREHFGKMRRRTEVRLAAETQEQAEEDKNHH